MIPSLRTTLLTARSDGSAPDPSLPVLVAGPGLGTGVKALWGPAVEALAPHFTVVGWDLPGHGIGEPAAGPFSIAELASAVVDALGAVRRDGIVGPDVPAYYAGVSLAGTVALQLGLDHPGVFSGLASVCSAARIGQADAWNERADLVEQAGTPTQVVGSAQRWFAPGFIESHPVITTDLLHTLQDADRFSYAYACRALAGFDVRDRLGEISDPVLALNGAEDVVCSAADAEFTASHVQRGTARSLAGVGHQAPAEDPDATAAMLAEVLLGKDA